jgi:hypothetical protein
MPTKTTPPTPPAPAPPPAERATAGWIALAAAAFAASELLAAVLVGRFFDWGRAEGLLFLAFRPWPLLALAIAASRFAATSRVATYAAALLLAAGAESLLLLTLGGWPWTEAGRGLAAGAGVALLFDLAVLAGRRWGGKLGRWAAAALLAVLLVVPGPRRPYDAFVLAEPASPPDAPRPKAMLMTGLPLVWGESGPFDPASRPAVAYQALQSEYDFVLLDTLEAKTLSQAPLLFLAQPHRLSPAELTSLDSWIRGGGRALILADPALVWPSELPLGDIRRPPPVHLLEPLLAHWGLVVDGPATPGRAVVRAGERRLTVEAPGSVRSAGLVARRGIGRGRVILVADADLLRDDLWAPLGPARHQRTSDNPLLIAQWLDELIGLQRRWTLGEVAWSRSGSPVQAMAAGLLPIALTAAAGFLLRRRRRC